MSQGFKDKYREDSIQFNIKWKFQSMLLCNNIKAVEITLFTSYISSNE